MAVAGRRDRAASAAASARGLTISGESHEVYDLMGKDTVLFHHAATGDADAMGTQYVQQARNWFDSMWETVAREIRT